MSGNTLPDLKFTALRAQNLIPGGGGAIPEMTLAWLQVNGATSNSIPDAWNEMLSTQFTAGGWQSQYTGHRADDWYKLLELLGYATAGGNDLNHINSRERLFWGSGGTFGPSAPIWGAIPIYTIYELPGDDFVLNLKNYCFANPAVDTWTTSHGTVTNPPTVPDGILTITWADVVEGANTITVGATNAEGGPITTQFTLLAIAGEKKTKPIFVSPMPNFYSIEGVEGSGSEVPPAPVVQSIYASDGGVNMNQYVTNPPVTAGTWTVSAPSVVTIDPDTGILSGRIDASPNKYSIQVGVKNEHSPDIGWSPVFNWEVLPEEGYVTDFDKVAVHPNLNGMTFTRGQDQTLTNHLAETATVTGDTAALIGQDGSGTTYGAETNVGYGIDLATTPLTKLTANLADVDGLPDNGILIEASFQVIFIVDELFTANEFRRIIALNNDQSTPVSGDPTGRNDTSEIAVFGGTEDNKFSLSCRTRPDDATDSNVATNGYAHLQPVAELGLSVGSIVDMRGRVSKTDGMRFWINVDGNQVVNNAHETLMPQDDQIVAIDQLSLGGDINSNNFDSNITVVRSRVLANGSVPIEEIEAWPTWEQPLPIIVQQPQSIQFDVVDPVEPPVEPPPDPNNDPIEYLNKRAWYGGWNWARVREGDTAFMFMDVTNSTSAVIKYAPYYQFNSPPTLGDKEGGNIQMLDFDPANPPAMFDGASFTFQKLPIPATESWREGRGTPVTNDTNGDRWQLTITNPQEGMDAWFNIIASNDSYSKNLHYNFGFRLAIHTELPWRTYEDIGSLYAMWSLEEQEPTTYRDDDPNIYGWTDDKPRGTTSWRAHYMVNTQFGYTPGDMSPETYKLLSCAATEGSGDLIPNGPDPFGAQYFHYYPWYRMTNRLAACNIGNAVGMRHTYPAGSQPSSSAGYTVAFPDWRRYAAGSGTSFEVRDTSGSSWLRVFTTGDDVYRIQIKGGAVENTGLAVEPCEATFVVASVATDGTVKLWAKSIWNDPPGPSYTATATAPAETLASIAFCAQADDSASDAMHGYFSIASVIHRAMASDTETDYLCRLMTKTLQIDGCFRENYHESY